MEEGNRNGRWTINTVSDLSKFEERHRDVLRFFYGLRNDMLGRQSVSRVEEV